MLGESTYGNLLFYNIQMSVYLSLIGVTLHGGTMALPEAKLMKQKVQYRCQIPPSGYWSVTRVPETPQTTQAS